MQVLGPWQPRRVVCGTLGAETSGGEEPGVPVQQRSSDGVHSGLRIAQVVTYLSPDNDYGGPARVAVEQSSALADLGHEVTLFAAAPVRRPEESRLDGVRLRLFPRRQVNGRLGFAGYFAPGLVSALRHQSASLDVAHLHLARDLVTLPSATALRATGLPYVIQTHGMIDPSPRLLSRPVDRWWTRPAVRGASLALLLSEADEVGLSQVQRPRRTAAVVNGVASTPVHPTEPRRPVIVFLARLQERKRPLAFVDLAARLADRLPAAEFVLAGPDEGEGFAVRRAVAASGLGDRLRWIGPVSSEAAGRLLATSRVHVLPSLDEVFPMTVVEAMRAGTPNVLTDAGSLSSALRDSGAVLLAADSGSGLAEAVERVFNDGRLAAELSERGSRLLRDKLDIGIIARSLEGHYRAVIDDPAL